MSLEQEFCNQCGELIDDFSNSEYCNWCLEEEELEGLETE